MSWLPFNFDSCGLDNWYLITVGNTLEADVFFVNDNFGQSVRGYFLRLWIKLTTIDYVLTPGIGRRNVPWFVLLTSIQRNWT